MNLVRDLAAAEEMARKAQGSVKIKRRELKHAKHSAEEAEASSKRWGDRLALAREKARAKEREAKGLPPLETKKPKVVDFTFDSDEEDSEDEVERVEGVFGTNNRSTQVSSIPWSQEERAALMKGLWDERRSGEQRYYNIWNLPIFRRNERSFDEVLAKCIDYKQAMILVWEKKQQEDPDTAPLQDYILSIRDQ